jgi:lysophospholipase L1-like esterase
MRMTLVATALAAGLAAPALAQDAAPKHILVFGDSLTWGWTPADPVTPTVRHPMADRWTSAMGEALGDGYVITAEGLSGRTTNIDDPNDPKLNGADVLPALLASHEPIDLVIIMLGTNDTKNYLGRTPLEIGLGAGELINMVHEAPGWDWTDYDAPEVLLVSPPPLGETIGAGADAIFDADSKEKSRALPEVYEGIATLAGEHFFNAGSVIETDGVDGIHFTAEANRTLGAAVAERVKEILAD